MTNYDDTTLDQLAALAEGGDAHAADALRDALRGLAVAIDKRLGREVGADRLTETREWRMLSARLYQRDPILQYMADGIRHKPALEVIREIQARMAQTPPRGRPIGTGAFRDRADFVNAMRVPVSAITKRGEYPSQSRVSAYLIHHGQGDVTERQLRRWCRQFGFKDWQDLLKAL